MRRLILAASSLAIQLVLSVALANAQTPPIGLVNFIYSYRICRGEYALCAASTCTPDGQTIAVNTANGQASFPEAACTCPVYDGFAIADVNGGNMEGDCKAPGRGKVWSLYAPKSNIPQAINDWRRRPAAETAAPLQLCSASENVGTSFANCFSFACTLDRKRQNGVRTATCLCPLGESLDGTPVAADTPIATPAGQCNSAICTQHPVGAPYPAAGDQANVCLGAPQSLALPDSAN